MRISKPRLNPILILGIWILATFILTPIVMFVSGIDHSGGEQTPITTLAVMIKVMFYGTAAISVLTPFIFRKWFKNHLWFSFVIIGTLIIVARLLIDNLADPYTFSESTEIINGNTIVTRTKYYDGNKFEKVRSVSYWKNNKKDSIWTTYSENGEMIDQETYQNGTLIKK